MNDYLKYITDIVDNCIKYDFYSQLANLVKVAKLVKSETNLLNLLPINR